MASKNIITESKESHLSHDYEPSDVVPWIKARIPVSVVRFPYFESLFLMFLALIPLSILIIGIIFGNTLLPVLFWVFVSFDLLLSSFLAFPAIRAHTLLQRLNQKLPPFFQINTQTYFSHYSILYRFCRILCYSLVTDFFTTGLEHSDFLIIISLSILCFFIYTVIASMYQLDPTKSLFQWYKKHPILARTLIVVICISLLGILARLYYVSGIATWDEGWYADIAARMAHGGNWFLPLYYSDSSNQLLLFDKPPFLFWLGAIGVQLFGNISLAVKWPMGVLSGLLGLFGFLIYHHQRRKNQLDLIPHYDENEPQSTIVPEPPESESQTTDGFATGIIFALLISLAWFVVFYGQTSYIDPAVIGISALTAVLAIKCIDHWFYGNYRRSFIYLILTGIVNAIDLFSKAWQGLLVGPPIALYFFIRFFQHFIPKDNFRSFWSVLRPKLFHITKNYETEVFSIFGVLITIIIFTIRQPTIYDGLIIPGTGLVLDLWGIIIGALMFFPLNAFLQTIFLTPFQESSQSSFSTGTATSSLKTDNHEDHNSRSNPSSVTGPMINSKIFPISLEKNFLFRIAIYGFFVMLLGLIGGFFGHFGYDFVFSRFNDAITQIFTTYLGGSSTGSTSAVGATALLSLQDSIMLGRWVTSLFSILSSLFFGIGAIWLVGIILLACLGLLATSIHYLLEKIFKTVQNVSTTSLLFPSWAEGIILDLSLLIPFIVVILPFIYWGVFLLFQGNIFNRDFFFLTISGIVLVLLAYLLSLGLLTLFTRVYRRSLQKMTISTSSLNLYVSTWNQRYKKILLFTSAMLIIIILSFIPFMWWIQYLDQNLSTFGYVIRKAGELYSDPNSPIECIPNPNNPGQNCLTYTWIFFDFYTNWRYSYTNAYNVVESLGGFIGPLFISCFPFFLAGIFAFYKRKDYANLTFYLSWFLLVLFIFIPAKFQLNYYYLGAFFPYFGTVAYGIFFSSQKLRTVIHFKDRYERMIVIFPLLLLLIFTQIIPYITQINTVLSNSALCAQFLASLILIIGLFIILALFFVRSIPGMFAAMLVTFNVQRYIWLNGWGQLDAQFLVINLVLIAVPLYLLRDRIPLRSLFFIGLIIFSGTLATSWWIYWNSNEGHNNLSYNGLENIGPFITAHGGAYNGSYWVFPEAGTRYALRYYTNGYNSINVFSFDPNYPFSGNSNSTMQTYIQNYPDLKFFVLLGSNSPFNPSQVPPETSFLVAYSWLETQPNWVFANRLVNLPVDNYIQLYVRSTVLTPTELQQLNLSTNIGQQNDFSLHRLNSFRQRVSYQSVFTTIQSLSIVNNPWFSNLISIRKWYGIKSIFH